MPLAVDRKSDSERNPSAPIPTVPQRTQPDTTIVERLKELGASAKAIEFAEKLDQKAGK